MRFPLAALLACAGAAAPLTAQDAPPVIPGGVQLVRVDVIVTDGKGRHVGDLRPDEFRIEEDGRPRTIAAARYVSTAGVRPPAAAPAPGPDALAPAVAEDSVEAAEPRSLAIVVDDPSFTDESRVRAPRAIQHLIDKLATPDTPILILRTGGGRESGTDFTTDRQQLNAVVAHLRPAARDGQGEPALSVETSLRTLGILQELMEDLSERPGRKALLFLSEGMLMLGQGKDGGVDERVLYALRRLTDTANHAGVTISTVDPAGLRSGRYSASSIFDQGPAIDSAALRETLSKAPALASTRRRELQEGPERLSGETGGVSLFGNDVQGGVERVWNDLDGYYLIGYEPERASVPAPGAPAVGHTIAVRVTRKGLTVRARRVYYTEAAEPSPAAPTHWP